MQKIEHEGEAEVQLAGRPFRIKKQFLLDAAEHKLTEKIARLCRALLIMHSSVDTTVDIVNLCISLQQLNILKALFLWTMLIICLRGGTTQFM
jgi:hypothetical protein